MSFQHTNDKNQKDFAFKGTYDLVTQEDLSKTVEFLNKEFEADKTLGTFDEKPKKFFELTKISKEEAKSALNDSPELFLGDNTN